LNEVVQGIEPGVDDGMAKPFKSAEIQRNVIVYEDDRSGTMRFSIADIGDYAVKE
jgi:DNA-binding response OmpR family regulator